MFQLLFSWFSVYKSTMKIVLGSKFSSFKIFLLSAPKQLKIASSESDKISFKSLNFF